MSPTRSVRDQEGLRRVLVAAAGVFVLAAALFVGYGVWRVVSSTEDTARGVFDIVVGGILLAMAIACVRVSRDDGTGQWCPECIARNRPEAVSCSNCGSPLG